MAKKISKWKKFKRFLKRNMTPTWARHFSYQVFALLTSVAMIVGVADYAVTKSYDERKPVSYTHLTLPTIRLV